MSETREEAEKWLDGIQRGSLGDRLEIQRLLALARKGIAAIEVAEAVVALKAANDAFVDAITKGGPTVPKAAEARTDAEGAVHAALARYVAAEGKGEPA